MLEWMDSCVVDVSNAQGGPCSNDDSSSHEQ